MNYGKIYSNLVEKARNRSLHCYSEQHHIVPRCLGGIDGKENIVKLTPEEHYLAHQLLVKIFPEERKLVFALHKMTSGTKRVQRRNKIYGWIRRLVAEQASINNPMHGERARQLASTAMRKRHASDGYKNPMSDPSIAAKRRAHGKRVICVETGQEFSTRVAAAEWLKSVGHERACAQNLTNALRDEEVSARGFHWRYK